MILGVLNPKGGTGKSTLATNLAREIARDGREVLLIDTDPQGTARDWQNRFPEDAEDFPDVIGIDSARALKDSLPRLSRGYDITIIDGSAKMEGLTGAAVRACNLILLPVQPSPADIWGVSDLVDIILARQEVTDGKPLAAFVISKHDSRWTRFGREVDQALSAYGLPVLHARTTVLTDYATAIGAGGSVVDINPSGKAADQIKAIKTEVLTLLGDEHTSIPRRHPAVQEGLVQ